MDEADAHDVTQVHDLTPADAQDGTSDAPDAYETYADAFVVPEAPEETVDVDMAGDVAADPDPGDPGDLDPEDAPAPMDAVELVDTCNQPCHDGPRPVILVHGINGSSANFATMIARLVADGWPANWIFAFDAKNPSWGCNIDNAAALQALAAKAMKETCQSRVDVIAHSMGSISSRYWIKNLGGQDVVNTYVTLGGMHHGLSSPCWAPDFLGVCVWKELCQTGEFIAQLNADPATPGKLHWVSMYGTADQTVPNESSHLDGAENIPFEGVEHDGQNGLQEVEVVYLEIRRVLGYPCWQ
jgi:triacylglycerol lipase